MDGGRRRWAQGALLRGAGLVLLGGCWVAMVWLLHAATRRPFHAPGTMELVVALAGFVCLSAGAALTVLGRHLLDRVEVSQRWAPRRRP